MSRDDLLLTNMRIMQSVTEQVIKYLAGLHLSGGLESARCYGPTCSASQRIPEGARGRDGWHFGHGAVPNFLGAGAWGFGDERAGVCAWRSR